MSHEPIIREHYGSHINTWYQGDTEERQAAHEEHQSNIERARRDASEREMAFMRAMNRPQMAPRGEPPPLKSPILTFDAAALDETIFERGIRIDSGKLAALGKKRFRELLALDHECRQEQHTIGIIMDLTSFAAVRYGLQHVGAFEVTQARPVKMSETYQGTAKGREAVRTVSGFRDLWKIAPLVPREVRSLCRFHDAFASLALGQSMAEKTSPDDRLRSRFFAGGRGERVKYFDDWLSVLPSLFRVRIERPLGSVLRWLCAEREPLPEPIEQAKAWFGRRAPEPDQVRIAAAVIDGFLRDFSDWSLWEFVGRATRSGSIDTSQLETWRKELCRRFPAIRQFHETVRFYFWRERGVGNPNLQHGEFQSERHRAYLDHALNGFLDCASLVCAQAIEETSPGAVVARFADRLFCQGKKATSLSAESITAKLAAAFPRVQFNISIEELS